MRVCRWREALLATLATACVAWSTSLAQMQTAALPFAEEEPYTLASDAICDCTTCGRWIETDAWQATSVFIGLEGSKQPQDFGVNAHFGGRGAFNTAVPLSDEYGLALQLGTAVNMTANAVQVNERIEGNSGRIQSFSTVGIFQRCDSGLLWGVVEDVLYQDYYDNFCLGQTRGKLGYRGPSGNEIGVQGAVRNWGADGQFDTIDVHLRPINQASVYYRHQFPTGVMIGGWVGACDGHSEANVALGDLPARSADVLFGSDIYAPLSDRLALFGEANFIMPTDTGTVDAYLGIAWHPWGGALEAGHLRWQPLFAVANNTSLAADLLRR